MQEFHSSRHGGNGDIHHCSDLCSFLLAGHEKRHLKVFERVSYVSADKISDQTTSMSIAAHPISRKDLGRPYGGFHNKFITFEWLATILVLVDRLKPISVLY